jgi:hypothetical protein
MMFPSRQRIYDTGGNTPTTTVGGTPTNPRCRSTSESFEFGVWLKRGFFAA